MLSARPSLNGNNRDDFAEAYRALIEAQKAIDAAASALRGNVLNGRNYQHYSNSDDLLISDKRRIDAELLKVRGVLGEIASEVVNAVGC